MDKKRKFLPVTLLIFFSLRIIAALFINNPVPEGSDAELYNYYALTVLSDSHWLHSSDFMGSRREPLYPIFLALTYLLFGVGNFLAVCALQAAINTLTVFIIYKLALKIFNEKIAYVTLFLSGCYTFYIWFAAFLLRETLVCFFFVLLFYFFYACLIEPACKKTNIFIVALAFFLLAHTDSRYLYLLPCIGMLFIVYKRFSTGIRNFLVFILLVIILSAPWGIRNYITYDNFVLINTYHFQPGWNIIKGFRYKKWITRKINIANNENYPAEEERVLIKKGLNPNNRSIEEIKAIKKDIYPPPTFWERKWFNLRELWRPFMLHGIYEPFPTCKFLKWSLRHNIVSIVPYGLLLPFALWGIINLAIKKNKIFWFFALPIFFHTLVHTIVWGEYRYRIPMDSFLIILGGYGIGIAYAFLSTLLRNTGYYER